MKENQYSYDLAGLLSPQPAPQLLLGIHGVKQSRSQLKQRQKGHQRDQGYSKPNSKSSVGMLAKWTSNFTSDSSSSPTKDNQPD
jgi:hypothetical protein